MKDIYESLQDIKKTEQFELDTSYYFLWDRICKLEKNIKSMDPLEQFALNGLKGELHELEHIAESNLDKIFECCQLLNIPGLFIGNQELVTLGHYYRGRVAVWCLVDVIRNKQLSGYCGNSYQYQISGLGGFVPERYIGKAWDVVTKIEIDEEPFRQYMVMTKREEKKHHGRTNYV